MVKQYYDIIAKAIHFLADNKTLQPSLSDLSEYIGLDEFHLQRVFSEWVGVTPKKFLQYLTNENAKQILKRNSVLQTAYECGLSGSGRLHDLMIQFEGMTPGEYKKLGKNITIDYGTSPSPFGECFIAITNKGICKLAFFDTPEELNQIVNDLETEWPFATLQINTDKIRPIAQKIFPQNASQKSSLKLLLKGTPFQIKVWEALLSIPEGNLVSYQDVANTIQSPKAVRAVASAIAKNHIAYLIPCHRVIRQNGDFGQYRWNQYRKQALIAWEAFKNNSSNEGATNVVQTNSNISTE